VLAEQNKCDFKASKSSFCFHSIEFPFYKPWLMFGMWRFGSVQTPLSPPALFFLGVGWHCVHLVRRPLFGLLYLPRMMDDDECGAASGLIGKGSRSVRRKPAPLQLYPPQIPPYPRSNPGHCGGQRLTDMALPFPFVSSFRKYEIDFVHVISLFLLFSVYEEWTLDLKCSHTFLCKLCCKHYLH
jgi:hypothetical protein